MQGICKQALGDCASSTELGEYTDTHTLGLRAWHGAAESSVGCTGSPQTPLKTITALTGLVRPQLALIDRAEERK